MSEIECLHRRVFARPIAIWLGMIDGFEIVVTSKSITTESECNSDMVPTSNKKLMSNGSKQEKMCSGKECPKDRAIERKGWTVTICVLFTSTEKWNVQETC